MEDTRGGAGFLFVGNLLCLDFVNTEIMHGGVRVDLLGEPADLVRWAESAGVLGHDEGSALATQMEGHRETLDEARRLRAAIRGLAEGLSEGRAPGPEVIDLLNATLRPPVRYPRIVQAGGSLQMHEQWEFSRPEHLLVPIAESAAELVCGADPSLVRKCKNEQCILFFYDTTRNHARSWCSMAVCGNRSKVLAHYRRKRQAKRD